MGCQFLFLNSVAMQSTILTGGANHGAEELALRRVNRRMRGERRFERPSGSTRTDRHRGARDAARFQFLDRLTNGPLRQFARFLGEARQKFLGLG